jgi:hypothetical protein
VGDDPPNLNRILIVRCKAAKHNTFPSRRRAKSHVTAAAAS